MLSIIRPITAPVMVQAGEVTRPVAGGIPSLSSFMRGSNVSGQDSGGSVFAFPGPDIFDYLQTAKKAKPIRLTFRHERMQPTVGGNLSAPYVDRYEGLVNSVLSRGGFPIVDPHNFGRYFVGSTFDDFNGPDGGTETIIGQDAGYTSAQFADFWTKLATRFGSPRIIYNLMNEPHDQLTASLTTTLNAAVAAIRALGRKNLLLVPFNGFSNRYGFINDQVAQKAHINGIVDSANNWAIDYHCYVNPFSSGTETIVQANFMADVETFTTWARSAGKKAFVGEFGVASDNASLAAASLFFKHIEENKDVWIGFSWWTSVMYQDAYNFQLLPTELTDGVGPGPYTDRLQMKLLEPLFAAKAVAPVVLLNATLTGTAQVGQVLGGLPAVFSGFPMPTIYYQWQRGSDDIPGANSATYLVTSADIGSTIRRIESAGNDSGFISSVTSSSAVIAAASTTWDAANKASTVTLTNGGLSSQGTGTSPRPAVRSNKGYSSGKFFHSIRSTGTQTANQATGLGMSTMVLGVDTEDHAKGIMYAGDGGVYGNSSLLGAGLGAWVLNDIIDEAVDLTAKLIWFRRNGGLWNNNGSANPETGVGGINIAFMTGIIYPVDRPWPNTTHIANFGATAYTHAAPAGFGNW